MTGSRLCRRLAAFVACGALLNGCTDDGRVGGDHAQCLNHPAAGASRASSVTATLDALVPSGAQVRCADSISFTLDGSRVDLVFVSYGELRDCPSGCFTSQLCAIHDGSGALLYSSVWYSAAEKPVTIPAGCPVGGGGGGNTGDCPTVQPGAGHPVT